MRAIVKAKPEPGIQVLDIPDPELKPKWVLIKVKASGICGSDLGIYKWPPYYHRKYEAFLPIVLGHEFSGDVVAVGEGVDEFTEGDKVTCMALPIEPCGTCYYCRTGRRNVCASLKIIGGYSSGVPGGMAEYVLAPAENLFEIPEGFSYDDAAVFEPLAVAFHAVHDLSDIGCGQVAVVLGPGPIGLLTLLTLKKTVLPRLTVVAGTKVDRQRLEFAEKLGADVTLNVDEEDPVSSVMDLTGNVGADVVYDATGSPTATQQGLDMLKKTGQLIEIGLADRPAEINTRDLVYTEKRVQGCMAYTEETWVNMMNALASKLMDPGVVISHRLPLEDAVNGFELAVKRQGLKVIFIT